MTTHEAFKIGFLLQCASEGLSEEATEERVKKAATMVKMAAGGGTWHDWIPGFATAKAALGKAWPLALWGTILGPPLIGAAGGAVLAKSRGDAYNEEDAKKREELAEYYRAIDQLSRAQQLRLAAA